MPNVSNLVRFICFDDTGRIEGVISGPRETTSPPPINFIEYDGDENIDSGWYVRDSLLIQKPEKPTQAHVFNYQAGQWELDIDLARHTKWSAVKAERDAEEFGAFEWGGYTFQCDEVSQRRIQGAVQLAAIDSTMTLDWTLADNSVQTFTGAEYVQIGQALANHVSQCHERGRILRQQIESATTQAELEAIVW